MKRFIILALLLLASGSAYAEPTSATTYITSIRPYIIGGGQGDILLIVQSSNVCNTVNFKIDLSQAGSKEAYAAALTAFVANYPVTLEVSDYFGCTGDWTRLQSITIYHN
jgi:hypothetical protein